MRGSRSAAGASHCPHVADGAAGLSGPCYRLSAAPIPGPTPRHPDPWARRCAARPTAGAGRAEHGAFAERIRLELLSGAPAAPGRRGSGRSCRCPASPVPAPQTGGEETGLRSPDGASPSRGVAVPGRVRWRTDPRRAKPWSSPAGECPRSRGLVFPRVRLRLSTGSGFGPHRQPRAGGGAGPAGARAAGPPDGACAPRENGGTPPSPAPTPLRPPLAGARGCGRRGAA